MQRKRITCLNLLAVLFLMQPRMLLAFFAVRTHCWLMFNLLSTRTSKSHSAELLSSHLASSMHWQNLALPFVKHHEIPLCPILQPVQVHLNGSTTTWCIVLCSNSSPSLYHLQICRDALCPITSFLTKRLNCNSLSISPWGTGQLVTCLQVNFVL